MPEKTERRLVAIMSSDVVDYSRLMGADEAGTLATMQAHRKELWDPTIEKFGGRVVGTAGDSLLVEYTSAVAAVEAAILVQHGMIARNADLPEGRQMMLRIGVNIGEVIVADDDIFGDGVNVAARLQTIADTGGIAISGNVHEQVGGKLEVTFTDDGEHDVKNIERPVHVWRWSPAGQHSKPAASAGRAALPLPTKPSIAVLPFDNMSDDPEQEYFSDGIAEDVITDLSKISALFVIARNTTFTYKGKAVNIQQVSRELGVRYVLEGSVRKAGRRVRINAQLIDGRSGGHLWAERYDGTLEDIFDLQDEITRKIVEALSLTLTSDETSRVRGRGTTDVEAYEWFLKGREAAWRHTREGGAEAQPMLERAIELDPNFAAAHALLGFVCVTEFINQWSEDPQQSEARGFALATRAVEIDDAEPQAHFVLALAHMWRKEHDAAIEQAKRAIALDPNYDQGYAALSGITHYAGRSAEALDPMKKAMRLDPQYPHIYLHIMAQTQFALEDYDTAIETLKSRLIRHPDSDISRVLLASAYGQLGRLDAARAAWQEALRINPDYSLEQRAKILPYKNPADLERFLEGLRKAGLPPRTASS